jgi:hypothetical protein
MKMYDTQEEFDAEVRDYVFKVEDDVQFKFDLITGADIKAWNIEAWNIEAGDIKAESIKAGDIEAENIGAGDIDAGNIKARNIEAVDIDAWKIDYFAVCFAYKNFKCKSVKGRRKNSKHFCLDSDIEFIEPQHTITIDGKEIEISEESFNELKNKLINN